MFITNPENPLYGHTEVSIDIKLSYNPDLLKYITNPTRKMVRTAVRKDGLSLRWVRDKKKYLCLEAVKQNGLAIRYVPHNPLEDTEVTIRIYHEIVTEAVKQNGAAIMYIDQDVMEYILTLSLDENGMNLEYVRNKTEDLCLRAVNNDGMALQFVDKQTEAIVKAALKNNPSSSMFVDDKFEYLL